MKVTRRQLAGLAVASAAAGRTAAASRTSQAPAGGLESAEQLYKSALEHIRKNTAEIRKLQIPIEVDPAFLFKA